MTALDDLRRRVEALESRATAEESSAPEPAPEPPPPPPAPPLWRMMQTSCFVTIGSTNLRYAAEIRAVADWLAARGCAGSADLLHAEARRAREGA